jgi:hypothetical protein
MVENLFCEKKQAVMQRNSYPNERLKDSETL